jgi:hypothetical protein
MDPTFLKQFMAGNVGGVAVTQVFLLGAGVLVEIPMAMVLLSRILGRRSNRWANIAAGVIMTVVQLSSLVVKTPALYYVFFSIIEVGCTAAIVWYAATWRGAERASAGQTEGLRTASVAR